MEDIIGKVIAGLLLAMMAWAGSFGFTRIGGQPLAPFKSYFACFCVVVVLSMAFAEISGAPIEAGEQIYEWSSEVAPYDVPGWSWKKKSDFAHKIFYISILPALFGVYCGRKYLDKD